LSSLFFASSSSVITLARQGHPYLDITFVALARATLSLARFAIAVIIIIVVVIVAARAQYCEPVKC
jgi:hypothetical protein